jgi:hypothetical protein
MQSLISRNQGEGLSGWITTELLAQTFLNKASGNDLVEMISEGGSDGNRTWEVWLAAMVNGTSFLCKETVVVLLGCNTRYVVCKPILMRYLWCRQQFGNQNLNISWREP